MMGATDEYVQSFWSYRTAALSDWMVDVVSGAVISTVLWKFWSRMTANS
jgi:VanZ family protein